MSTDADIGGEDEGQVLVAEFALGLLDGAEHRGVARRIGEDPALRADLHVWRQRLSSLDREFAETAPPVQLLPRIEQRLFGAPAAATPRSGFWQSLALWRGLAGAAVAVALVAVGINLAQPPRLAPEALATQLVAALQANEGSGVEFLAVYDQSAGQVRITSLKGTAVADKDYELWAIKGSAPAVSMGVVPVNEKKQIPLTAALKASIEPGTVFAVTLEQKGGSPTGVAQGPIVAVGTATAI